ADRELEAGRLAAREVAQARDEAQQAFRRVERGVARGRDAILAHRHATRGGDLRADLGRRQHAAVAGLGALRKLDLDQLDLLQRRALDEAFLAEHARARTGAEVARADFPADVAAVLA